MKIIIFQANTQLTYVPWLTPSGLMDLLDYDNYPALSQVKSLHQAGNILK